jgi:hypothetical protein
MVRFARHLVEANISMKNVPERIGKSFTTAVPHVYILEPGSTAFENVNGRECYARYDVPLSFSLIRYLFFTMYIFGYITASMNSD